MCHGPPPLRFDVPIDTRRTGIATVVLLLAAAAALLVDGALAAMIKRTSATACPPEAASTSCVATIPATVAYTWDDYGEGEPYERLLSLETSQGPAEAWLTIRDAERLDVDFDTDDFDTDDFDTDDDVTVTMFDGVVTHLTAPNGETAPARHTRRPALAALELAGWVLAIVLAVAAVTRLRVTWLRPALATSAIGALTALVITLITDAYAPPQWTAPIMAAAYLLVAVTTGLVAKPKKIAVRHRS
jgi:hypothetical protein